MKMTEKIDDRKKKPKTNEREYIQWVILNKGCSIPPNKVVVGVSNLFPHSQYTQQNYSILIGREQYN